LKSARPRDLSGLRDSLATLPGLAAWLCDLQAPRLAELRVGLNVPAESRPAFYKSLQARFTEIFPTPTVEIAVKLLKAAGGICVTASHNPAQWNALKFFNARGEFITTTQYKRLEKLFEAGRTGR